MYFKVNHSGCAERKGLCQVRYDLFLDPKDHNYNEHHVEVPVIPKGGYPGKLDIDGEPVDQKNYDKWFSGLKKVWQNNPFCCHFVYHGPNVTDDEILKAGEDVLKMGYENWEKGNLHLNKNKPVIFSADNAKIQNCKNRVASIKSTDFEALKKAK
jgi:hypothetical protein